MFKMEWCAFAIDLPLSSSSAAPLIEQRQVSKLTLSYVGTNKALEAAYLAGDIALELNPQGSIAERLRAGGHGIPAVYTRTGADTVVETGSIPQRLKPPVPGSDNTERIVAVPGDKKESRVFNGKKYILEPAITGDVAILRAWKVDKAGNCRFR